MHSIIESQGPIETESNGPGVVVIGDVVGRMTQAARQDGVRSRADGVMKAIG